MLHGKKGFERLVWASKNVLNRKYTWFFVDLNKTEELKRATVQNEQVESPTANQSASPICHFQQELKVIRPDNTVLGRCAVPIVDEEKRLCDPLYEEQLLEWLGLVLLDSPRVRVDDAADPYLCRYELPEGVQEEGREALMEGTLHHIQWKGFMPSQFVSSLLLAVKQETGAHWFGMNVSTFGGSAYTMICRNGKEILLWDLE
jgi:ribonuclease P/MRP protein subunit RPP40